MNKPVAWIPKDHLKEMGKAGFRYTGVSYQEDKFYDIPLYTHPVKDREKDRLRFSDEAFNRWLDECISDSGHTVYDLVENVCEAWHGWENSQYYTHPVKELHLSLQKEKETGELLAVTYTDDEHRIVEVLWQRPPAKELTYEDGIEECAQMAEAYAYMSPNFTALAEELRAILKKAKE